MKLSDLEFKWLLPSWMRADQADIGLSNGINKVVKRMMKDIYNLSTWDVIDQLSERELDEIAWELNLLWYDGTASIETKRDLVRTGLKVWGRLGTPWSVENVITAYFGEGYIKEWFEYQGEPGHFSVYSSNPTVNNENLKEFLRVMEQTKRKSAKLDKIYITLSGRVPLSAGCRIHESSIERYKIGTSL